MAGFTLALPMPPSVNAIWRTRRGKNGKPQYYLDPRYSAWKRHCDGVAMGSRNRVTGQYTVAIKLNSAKRNGDCDNRIKAVLDWLARTGMTPDDKHCNKASAEWAECEHDCEVTVTPEGPAHD